MKSNYSCQWLKSIVFKTGLYWYLNHGGSELTALSQSGFGYMEEKDYEHESAITNEDQSNLDVANTRHGSNKHYIKDENYDWTKSLSHKAFAIEKKPHTGKSDYFKYSYDTVEEDSAVDEKAPERLCNPPGSINAAEESMVKSILILLQTKVS